MRELLQNYIKIGISDKPISEIIFELCNCIKKYWEQSNIIGVEIYFNNQVYKSTEYNKSKNFQKQDIVSNNKVIGSITLYFKNHIEKVSLFTENLFQLSVLLSGFISERKLHAISYNYEERIKELQGITKTTHMFNQQKSLSEKIQEICNFIPEAMQFPEHTVVEIVYNNLTFQSKNFTKTKWVLKHGFKTNRNKNGKIAIYYTKEFPKSYKGPFLKEELDFIVNISALLTAIIQETSFQNLIYENNERLKELEGINNTQKIINKGLNTDDTLQAICDILPASWQYPEYTCARIIFDEKNYYSSDFQESIWKMSENFITFDNKIGTIDIYYTKEFPKAYEGPFLKEERNFISNICGLIRGFLNDNKGRLLTENKYNYSIENKKNDFYRESLIKEKQPLQNFISKQTLDKYIYLDMMKYKVKEILFVATLYDAFNLEMEDSFFEKFMGPIYQYSIFSLPRIIGVSSQEQALELLENSHFDLIILMVGPEINAPIELSKKIKTISNELPIYLLLNQNSNISYFENLVTKTNLFNKIFIWDGNSQIFFAMVKSLEDIANVENDTKVGLVRAILLIEDSAQFYSKFLPTIYSVLFEHVGKLISDYDLNELEKISRMRSRPKLLWARNYEQAMFFFNKYKDFITCVISDAEFEKAGIIDKRAGIHFLNYVREYDKNLPILIQSSEAKYAFFAKRIKATFINKNNELLLHKISRFVIHNFGYGDFIFRNSMGKPINKAKNLREFETILQTIPDESLKLHADQNQFSIWLMGRGEIELATKLNPIKLNDFHNLNDFRKEITSLFRSYRKTKKRGKIINFEETIEINENSIINLSSGSLGGKGRGIAFINALIQNLDFNPYSDSISICTPKTAIIGTSEFEKFIKNNFSNINLFSLSFEVIKKKFVAAELSQDLRKKLIVFLEQITKPIAVRSSSIFEDSVNQPLAGVFNTYIIPNNEVELEKRLENLETAIKLIYASVFGEQVKIFYKSTNHKIEEEKMAVILQELIGNYYDNYFYPHISGVAQSYNYYPVAHMKPEEGIAVCAVGLGFYIVDGGQSYRFSPQYPKTDILTVKDLLQSSQKYFLAVDFTKKDIHYIEDGERGALTLLPIDEAVKHKTLTHCASTFNFENNTIEPGIDKNGPRIINFANILKHDYTPLSEIITLVLNTVKEAMGTPVEIEFAVDLDKSIKGIPSFYLLQIKPLTGSLFTDNTLPKEILNSSILLKTTTSMGNGIIENIFDIVFIDLDKFDKLRTLEMVSEIESINKKMILENKKYILIGPGRWGTSDKFLGIPVVWSQISNAKIIVEISLSNFPLDASLGSHFFHNITTMNIGYFAIEHTNKNNYINWEILKKQKVVTETNFFKHIELPNPLVVQMNGKERNATIYYKQ